MFLAAALNKNYKNDLGLKVGTKYLPTFDYRCIDFRPAGHLHFTKIFLA